MPRLDISMRRREYELLGLQQLDRLMHGLRETASAELDLPQSAISVELVVLEHALGAADIAVDVCYSTGEHEVPGIQTKMPGVCIKLREYLREFVDTLPSEVKAATPTGFERTAVWQDPWHGGHYEEDDAREYSL